MKKKTKKVLGVGINDVDYPVLPRNLDGSQTICPYYARWKDMLRRCYSSDTVLPTYSEVTHVEDWTYLSNFKAWMETKLWQGRQLDKDILLPMNKTYGPDTCAFVPQWLNGILVCQKAGDLPLGVTTNRRNVAKPYTAACRNPARDSKFCGNYASAKEAHIAWQNAKCQALEDAILLYMFDEGYEQKVANALHERIDTLQNDISKGCETKYFT